MGTYWVQYTYDADYNLKYEPKHRSDSQMVALLAQVIRLIKAGENIEFYTEIDGNYDVVYYKLEIMINGEKVITKFDYIKEI